MPAKKKGKTRTKAKTKSKAKTRKKASTGKAWTAAEIRKLRTGYKKKPASQLAKELGRSLASVRGKISALGLTKGAPAKKSSTKKKTTRKKAAPKKRTTRKKTTSRKKPTRRKRK